MNAERDKERARVLALLEAHKADIPEMVFYRLASLIAGGVDLDEEMKLPIGERVPFVHWPDEKPAKPKRVAKPRKRK